MAGRRKDLNRRNLPNGVSQKKDGAYKGRYCYTYEGLDGQRHNVYSYRLYETDPVPKGKKLESCVPLMTIITGIERDKQDRINTAGGGVTLNEMFEKYMELKPGIKESTRAQHYGEWKLYVQNNLGLKKISKITYIDIKSLYLLLLWDWPNRQTGEKGLSIGSVMAVHEMIYSALELARKNKLIRENPAEGIISEIKAENKSKVQTDHQIKSLTVEQQRKFLSYVKTTGKYSEWYDHFIVLFGTGMRIGELSALRREDLDFKHNIININFSMERYKGRNDSERCYHMHPPKSSAGKRAIPMFPEVKEALLRQLEHQLKTGLQTAVVDGYSGFVFLSKKGNPINYSTFDGILYKIVASYNNEEIKLAEKEKREPELLPRFSAHDIRHTFATRMAENNANQLVMKKVMGHERIETTLDIYAEATPTEENECFDDLEGKMSLA